MAKTTPAPADAAADTTSAPAEGSADTPVQTPPAPTADMVAPQTEADLAPGTDGSSAPSSALEVLALAGDEAARRALGQPTADGRLSADARAAAAGEGFTIGEAAPADVYVDEQGNLSDGAAGDEGFRGTQIAAKGAVVTEATVRALQAAGAL